MLQNLAENPKVEGSNLSPATTAIIIISTVTLSRESGFVKSLG